MGRRVSLMSIAVVTVLALSSLGVLVAVAPGPTAGRGLSGASIGGAAAELGVPGFSPGSGIPSVPSLGHIHPDVPGYVFILPDGALSGAPSPPITITGDVYTLTADYTGAIVDERNGSTFDGQDFTLTSNSVLGFGFQVNTSSDVTVEDLYETGATRGFEVVNSTQVVIQYSQVNGTAGLGFGAVDSSWVSADDDTADGTIDYGFAANDSYDVTWEDDATLGNRVGFIAVYSNTVNAFYDQGNAEEYGAVMVYGTGFEAEYDSFLADTTDGVDLVLSSAVYIYDLTTTGSAVGLYADYGSGLSVEASTLTDSTIDGATIEDFDGSSVSDTNLSGAAVTGLLVSYGSYDEFEDDVASQCGINGVVAENLSESTISDLVADHDGWNGLYLGDDSNVDVVGSTFNDIPGGNGTFFKTTADYTFSDDVWQGDDVGLYTVGTHDGWVEFSNASDDGVAFFFVDDVQPYSEYNNLFNDSNGIVYVGSVDFTSYDDNVTQAGVGIVLEVTADGDIEFDSVYRVTTNAYYVLQDIGSLISSSTARNVGADAFVVTAGTGTELAYDQATNVTDVAYVLEGVQAESLLGSNATDAHVGFAILGSSNVNVSGNWFDNDTIDFEIPAASVGLSEIVWNNFLGGGGWEFDATGAPSNAVTFDEGYPGGGNYWSNHTAPDQYQGPGQNVPGRDGIVDTPMNISLLGGFVDHYPLTRPIDTDNLTVVFVEHGLPTGTPWGIQFGPGDSGNSTSTGLSFWLGSAAYRNITYLVYAPAGWRPSAIGGTIEFTGAREEIDVNFSAVTYPTTFAATGLAGGSSWQVVVDGTPYSATGSSLVVPLANGTHAYTVEPVAGYVVQPRSGNLTVNGTGPTVTIGFTAVLYSVSFQETGLPSGTSWSVTFGGTTESATTASIEFSVANGSYAYTVGNVSGYGVTPGSGHQLIAGPGASVTVVYTATPASTLASSALLYGLLAAVVVLAALVVLLLVRGRRKPAAAGVGAWSPPAGAATPPPTSPGAGGPPSGAVAPPPPPDWKET